MSKQARTREDKKKLLERSLHDVGLYRDQTFH